MNQVPQRIGDAERDRAVSLLREHHAAGRLDSEEFEERMTRALAARTQADLDPLFNDLPRDPHATMLSQRGALVAATDPPPPATPGQRSPRSVASWVPAAWALLWVGAVVVGFATAFMWWWVWLIPIAIGPLMTLAGVRRDHQAKLEPGSDPPKPTDQP